MSNQDADLRGRFVDGTLGQGLEQENAEKEGASESSSSSDGSNEPNSDQSTPSNFQSRPDLTLESGMTNLPTISMTQSQQTEQGQGQIQGQREVSIGEEGGIVFQLLDIPEKVMNNVSMRNHNHGLGNGIRIETGTGTGIGTETTNSCRGLFPFDSSSALPYSPISRTGDGSPFTRQSHHQLALHNPSAATFGAQEYRFQNTLGQGMGSTSFNPIEMQNMPIQKRMGLNMGLSLPPPRSESIPINSNDKMKMTWQDNILGVPNLHPHSLLSQGQGQPQSYGFPNNTRYFRNTVYDPMYEAMGLPVDPHLRMFLARPDHGDREEH